MAGVAVAGIAMPAFADRPVQMSFNETSGYARITAKWGDGDETAPKISAQITNQVLVITFPEKVTLNLDKLKEGLPNWAAVTFMDPDGMTARIGLKQTPRLALSTSVDLTAIDLISETINGPTPPKLVSPLVARKTAEAEAKRIAAIPPPVEPPAE